MTQHKVPVLDIDGLIPADKMGTGTADGSKVLKGDRTWGIIPSAGHTVTTEVNFGVGNYGPEYDSVTVTITGQTWVTSSSIVQAWVAMEATADHDPEDIWLENLTAYVGNIIAGQGFDITVRAPCNTWGRYKVYAKES